MRLALLIAVWGLAVVGGFGLAVGYSVTPGRPADAPTAWPAESAVPRDPARPTLVLFLHPRCPCSAASLAELDGLLARADGRLAAVAVFADDPGRAASRLWRNASAMPGLTVLADDGAERRRFGAFTSGETLLYAADGRLLFRGGVTAGRGHVGDNPGRSAVERLVAAPAPAAPAPACGPVFGCPLCAAAASSDLPRRDSGPSDDSLLAVEPRTR